MAVGVLKNMVGIRAEQDVKVAGWTPMNFGGLGVRWGVGWLKTTRGETLDRSELFLAVTAALALSPFNLDPSTN